MIEREWYTYSEVAYALKKRGYIVYDSKIRYWIKNFPIFLKVIEHRYNSRGLIFNKSSLNAFEMLLRLSSKVNIRSIPLVLEALKERRKEIIDIVSKHEPDKQVKSKILNNVGKTSVSVKDIELIHRCVYKGG